MLSHRRAAMKKAGFNCLVVEFHHIPVGFKIPQGDKKEDVMQIKGQGDLIQFRFYPQLVLIVSFQLLQGDQLDITDIGHYFLGLGKFLDGKSLVSPFTQGEVKFLPKGIIFYGVMKFYGG
jgi:hypothetical protein